MTHPHPAAPLRRSLALLVVLTLALLAPGPAVADDDAPPSGSASAPAPTSASRAEAERALAAVEDLFADGPASRGPREREQVDATLVLLDLTRSRDALSEADQARADVLLARPDQSKRVCSTDICVHYQTTGANAPDQTDTNANGVPDYVDTVLATMQHVHDTYVAAGYRQPKSDGTRGGGGTGLDDVYLKDIGDDGYYGYCQTDERSSSAALYGFCVLDEDYSEFGPQNTPLQNLQVTAAHEYFHAVQFGYDAAEDVWLLEATATWMEDEMYDGVDDNVQYLADSPLARPGVSLDSGNQGGFFYGVWSFFRYLTEQYPDSTGGLPNLVREIWERADGTSGAPDDYSWQAVRKALAARGSDAPAWFASYAAANRRPAASYDEGGANDYPTAPLSGKATLTPSAPRAAFERRLSHLASGTLGFTPSSMSGSGWTLKVRVDMASSQRGSLAVARVVDADGTNHVLPIALNAAGDGARTFRFGSAQVRTVEVTLVNASGRFRCGRGTAYSCQGSSRDDRLLQSVTARAVR